MAELITLTTPDVRGPAAPDYRIGYFGINVGFDLLPNDTARVSVEAGRVEVALVSSNLVVRRIPLLIGQAAIDSAKQLNKANLTTKSLEKRLLELVVAFDAKYAGVISGSPD